MNIICMYDAESKKCIKFQKLLKRYLYPIQKSVFQGTLTPAQFKRLKAELKDLSSPKDSVYLFYTYNDKDLYSEEIGKKQKNRRIIID
ncbi:CRISPR-associated endonuclease Cas2 [uncultured Dubosiella sp.]|uniref:CRISPR-associated endonuclease Cas2 n=1 Tax=uncultured Dubosiella sp. TaxID=1937011 RepID=UPI00272F9FC4|nr:CRISPR-associated endonuclease Cas2 [uncultured Dubosiella sp.]